MSDASPGFEPLTPDDPASLGPFTLLARIGSGGMGVVYLGRDDDVFVAIKRVHAEFAHQREFRARLSREVTSMRRVQGPFTARLVAADVQGTPQWLAMEYFPGPTLASYVADRGPMPAGNVDAFALGLAQALRDIHRSDVIHRDLKPSNIILTWRGPQVVDFGIATASDATSLTGTGQAIGSMAWMSPEQIEGGTKVGPATDVFSWALVTYFAATGHSPFGEGNSSAVAWRIVNGEADLSEWPESLASHAAVLRAALSHDPSQRPTIDALVADLSGVTGAGIHDVSQIVHARWDPESLGLDPTPSLPVQPVRTPGAPAPGDAAVAPARRSNALRLAVAGSALLVVATIAGVAIAFTQLDNSADAAAATTPEPDSAADMQAAPSTAANAGVASGTDAGSEAQPDPPTIADVISEGATWWRAESGSPPGLIIACRQGPNVEAVLNPRYASDAGLSLSGSLPVAAGPLTLEGNAGPIGQRDVSTVARVTLEPTGTDQFVGTDAGGYSLSNAFGSYWQDGATWRPATDEEILVSIGPMGSNAAKDDLEDIICQRVDQSTAAPDVSVPPGIPQGVAFWGSGPVVFVTQRSGDSLLTARREGIGGTGCFKGVITGDSVEGAYSYTTAADRQAGYAPPRMISTGPDTIQFFSNPSSTTDLLYTRLTPEQVEASEIDLAGLLAFCENDMS